MATMFYMVKYIFTDVTSGRRDLWVEFWPVGQHLDQVSLLKPQLKRWLWDPCAVLSGSFFPSVGKSVLVVAGMFFLGT